MLEYIKVHYMRVRKNYRNMIWWKYSTFG